jgi:myosin-5
MLTRLIRDEDKYAFGKTKIFFRAGQVALMEKWRIDRLNHSASIIQKFIKMFIYRRQYLKKRAIALKIQTAARAFLARKKLRGLKEQAAATKIQSQGCKIFAIFANWAQFAIVQPQLIILSRNFTQLVISS